MINLISRRRPCPAEREREFARCFAFQSSQSGRCKESETFDVWLLTDSVGCASFRCNFQLAIRL